MKTMKTNTIILIASMLIMCVQPLSAQTTLQWKSTSAIQDAHSGYTPRVIAVDAPEARYKFIPMQSTSTMMETGYVPTPEIDSESTPKGTIRRGFDTGGESGQSEESPIGEPWALLLFAAATAGVMAYRQRKVMVSCTSTDLTD